MEDQSNFKITEFISRQLQEVKTRITLAAEKSGRDPSLIKVVVVSKKRSVDVIKAAIGCGITIFGENYPEEGEEKIQSLKEYKDLEWHMIGHVQSRKSDIVSGNFHFLHSLDSLKLAHRLENSLIRENKVLKVFLQVNMSGEASKSGFNLEKKHDWTTFIPIANEIMQLPHLQICGLMTMPPLSLNKEDSRPVYQKLNDLRQFMTTELPDINLSELSIGTSFDFPIAVEEGGTMLRIGEAILGPRMPRKL